MLGQTQCRLEGERLPPKQARQFLHRLLSSHVSLSEVVEHLDRDPVLGRWSEIGVMQVAELPKNKSSSRPPIQGQ